LNGISGRRRLPLGRSAVGDEFQESGVEWWPWLGVNTLVGSVEFEVWSSVVGDGPAVLVEEPVVVSAEEDEIVEVGGASVGPVDDMMDLEPVFGSASNPPAAVSVPVFDLTP
jgi:hypothetical protein